MARNKYPEQTIERILAVATRLFLEKGYEKTSIQDILDELGGLTKGAIYHHFKSKEDIFDAVASNIGKSNADFFAEVKNEKNLNAAEKLQKLVKLNISSAQTRQLIEMAPSFFDNPKFLAMQLKRMRDEIAPKDFGEIIEEGVKDGSIITDNPLELAEVIVMLLNIWLNPLIFGNEPDRMYAKCKVINELLERYHLTLFDDEIIEKLKEF